jgi:tripartite-type tricarboxylate transporter receptor subunit TctC
VPTMRESGVPIDVTVWYGICAPSAVPKPIIAKLNADLHRALNAADTQKKLVEIGVDVAPSTPEQFAAFIKSETETWTRVVREGKIPQQTY